MGLGSLGALHPILDAQDGSDLSLVAVDFADAEHQVGFLGLHPGEAVHLLREVLGGELAARARSLNQMD